jgi:hypothetical protein
VKIPAPLRRSGKERERERAEREAEAERQQRRTEAEREAASHRRLEQEKERHRRLWIAAGNPAEKFEECWPEIERRVLMSSYEERARGRYESII